MSRPARAARSRTVSPAAAVRELYAVDACKAARCGRCGIRWVPTAKVHPRTGHRVGTGDPIPLDHGRDPQGGIVLDQDPKTGAWSARPLDDGDDPDRPRYSPHWTSCHNPGLYREALRRADPNGMFPPLRSKHTSTGAGPCSTCSTVFGNRYGPNASTLCPPCFRLAVARWGPEMAPTVAGWSAEFRRLMVIEGFEDDA